MPGAFSPPRTAAPPNTAASYRPAPGDDPAMRAVAAIGLITVGIIHALEIPGSLTGPAWLTVGFCLLAVAAPVAGLWLLAQPSAAAWGFGGLMCVAAESGYILTRSVPMPGDVGDVGNWLEPLGVASLITQGVVIILAALVLGRVFRTGQLSLPLPRGIRTD